VQREIVNYAHLTESTVAAIKTIIANFSRGAMLRWRGNKSTTPWAPWPSRAEVSLGGVKALGYNIFCALASAATRRPRASHLGRGSRARSKKVAIK